MGKSSGTTSTTASSTQPAEFQLPYVKNLLSEAQKVYNTSSPYYAGNMTAAFTPYETAAQTSLANSATSGALKNSADQAAQAYKYATTDAIDVGNNKYVQDAIKASTQNVTEQLLKSTLPALRASSIGTGNLGSSRSSLSEAAAVDAAAEDALNASAGISNNAYQSGLAALTDALKNTGTTQTAIQAPATTLSNVGAQQRAYNQALLNEDVAKWQYNTNLAANKLADYAGVVSGNYGATGTTTTQGASGDALSQYIGAIAALFGM